ncbi:hypothetical protein LRY60_04000 [Candidatus Woesebacteria bacterium]|nr:hypothetical protein [Candidatus Woesebacteria bacterium]
MLHKDTFLHQLSDLVAIPTVTADTTANQQAIEYIRTLLSPQANVRVIENAKAKILIASNSDTLQPDIGYLVHVDVVAASEKNVHHDSARKQDLWPWGERHEVFNSTRHCPPERIDRKQEPASILIRCYY